MTTTQPDQSPRKTYGEYLDTDLIAWAPCGCWLSVMLESADFADNAQRVAEFARDAQRADRHGRVRVERVPHSRFGEIVKAEQAAGKKSGCDHEPQWGGIEPTHRMCPRCHKDVKLKKNGTLSAHKLLYGTCPAVPYERKDTGDV